MEIDSQQADDRPKIVGAFIDAVVLDPESAQTILDENQWLKESSWILGESLVHFLAVEGYSAAVEWLLERGFAVDVVNEFGDTALFDVIKLGNFEMAALLLRYGANPRVVSPTYGTLREYAQLMGDEKKSRFVESICREVNNPGSDGERSRDLEIHET